MINPNEAYEDLLYFDYLRDPDSVTPEWKVYFEKHKADVNHKDSGFHNSIDNQYSGKKGNSGYLKDKTKSSKIIELDNGDILERLGNIQSTMSRHMEDSLEIPTATSTRMIPVKALDENRRIINKYLVKLKRRKISFTHLLTWALVRTILKFPHMNDSFQKVDSVPYRLKKKSINIGLAVDIQRKDGTRLLLVPNIKNAQDMVFTDFIDNFEELVYKTRNDSISPEDIDGTTITITNPGMIGTTASSPRLMKGQGLIVAVGSIDYPSEFQAVRPEILTTMAVSKVVTITNTYDHRIIQGAESAEFLSYLNQLLIGKEQFYDQIFASLKIPFEPIRWEIDNSRINKTGQISEQEIIEKGADVMLLINAYRVRGHLLASVNPLGLVSYYYPELDPAYYGFTIWDLDRFFHADDTWDKNNIALRDIIELMRETYCGHIGIEFMHIQDTENKSWIKKTLESTKNTKDYTKDEKLRILRKIIDAEELENFLHTKFVGHKRFSLEGGESLIVMLDHALELASDNKLPYVIIGMAHRGRLNVITNNIGIPLEKLFDEFEGYVDFNSYQGSGDVKYHLGADGTFISSKNESIHVKLAPNPSHLELVNPVIEGMARALDNEIHDIHYSRVLPILVHGDAAFAGQGIVAETLNLSQLEGYHTGGTIHIVVNNQIGFTTTAQDARSTVYATDIAKMIQVPIIHVNGNDPEAVCNATNFAFEYRNKFASDVIIDMLCYRKYGHNEADEPSYTQPLLYKKIKSMKPVGRIYQEILAKEKVLTIEESDAFFTEVIGKFYDVFTARAAERVSKKGELKKLQSNIFEKVETKVSEDKIRQITYSITTIPDKFKANPKILSLFKKRNEMILAGKPAIDWAMAEALSFGAILLDNKDIRISGQDTRRGTFSQRHAVIVDFETEDIFIPLNYIREGQARIRIFDSPLSELAVLGFEYGYSVIANNSLTLWEAQFGDFANMAQPIIDQFISCGEVKWGQKSNLVLLLPHSYDGQGPEHSSARLERFLQLCAENNMIVCNMTTPAQYFHVLRRQTLMTDKKPLIIMTPKSMLRHPMAVSSVDDLTNGKFMEIIDDDNENKDAIKKIALCSGKFYYDLISEMKNRGISDIALIRVEQLYPLEYNELEKIIKNYSKATNVHWVQEEPENMGAWRYIQPHLQAALNKNLKLTYIGRNESPATATGIHSIHTAEIKSIFEKLFN